MKLSRTNVRDITLSLATVISATIFWISLRHHWPKTFLLALCGTAIGVWRLMKISAEIPENYEE